MASRKLTLAPAATGLVVANLVTIGVVIACLLVTRAAWQLRDDALAALAQARATAMAAPTAGARTATMHAPPLRLRASTLDRILLFGILGGAGSVFFTWRLITRSRMAPAGRVSGRTSWLRVKRPG